MRCLLIVLQTLVLYVNFGGAANITTCKLGVEINGETGNISKLDHCVNFTVHTSKEYFIEDSSSHEYITVSGSNGEIFYYHVDSLCFSNSSREQVIVTTCGSACNPNHPKSNTRWSPSCISKCCPLGWRLDIQSGSCIQTAAIPPSRDEFFDAIKADKWMQPNLFYDPHMLSCRREFTGFRTKLLTKHELVTLVSTPELETTRQLFCLDSYQPPEESQDNEVIAAAMICLMDRSRDSKEHMVAYAATTIFLLFLIAFHCSILAAHAVLWAQQSCYGWTVMVCSGSQITMGISAVFNWIIWRIASDPSVPLLRFCGFSGVLWNFTFLGAFTWTLLLAYELWRKISSTSAPDLFYKTRFRVYCLVGFIPSLLVVFFKVWNFFAANPLAEFHDACNYYFQTFSIYIEVPPVVFLYACIITFGVLTLKRMRELRLARQALNAVVSRRQKPFIRRIKLIWKLMAILGVFFITDIVCEVWENATDYRNYYYRFPLQTFVSALQAFAQFHIFVCSGNIRLNLIKRHPGLEKYLDFCRKLVGCARCRSIYKESAQRAASVFYMSNQEVSVDVI